MTVQTSYKIVPSFAFHGQVTDIGTQKTIITAPAEGDIGVGLGVCISTDNADRYMAYPFSVKLPTLGADVLVGVTVRSLALPGNPPNDADGVPYYPDTNPVAVLRQGAIWIKTERAITDTQVMQECYVVHNDANFPLGTLLPDADSGNAHELLNASFMSVAAVGEMVKVILGSKT